MDNSFKAKCGHVTRKINQDEPLKGKVLKTALDAIDYCRKGKSDEQLEGIAEKLVKGQSLTDYEAHIMREVVMLNYRTKDGDPLPTLDDIIKNII